MNRPHVPVMLEEVLEAMRPWESVRLIADATLGAGGHAEAMLESCPHARLVGFDQDMEAIAEARVRLERFGNRVSYVNDNFRNIKDSIAGELCSVTLFDLGVSSMQLDRGYRGFSFQEDGPLDMRMGSADISASDIVNGFQWQEMADIFRTYGEERFSGAIARGIGAYREKHGEVTTTAQLVEIIRHVLPAPVQRKGHGHPARRVFQALRIAVNDELGALEEALQSLPHVCDLSAGVAIFITYHSLEDRIVKLKFREWEAQGLGRMQTRKPTVAGDDEASINRRSRSAKLRVFQFGRSREKINRMKYRTDGGGIDSGCAAP